MDLDRAAETLKKAPKDFFVSVDPFLRQPFPPPGWRTLSPTIEHGGETISAVPPGGYILHDGQWIICLLSVDGAWGFLKNPIIHVSIRNFSTPIKEKECLEFIAQLFGERQFRYFPAVVMDPAGLQHFIYEIEPDTPDRVLYDSLPKI